MSLDKASFDDALSRIVDAASPLASERVALADVIIVTGGAWVGERYSAKSMFAAAGLELLFANVAIKPGQPVWLGRSRSR